MTDSRKTRVSNCRVCSTPISPFMSFGPMPIANGFLEPENTDNEYFFELAPAFCGTCGMFQIIEQPLPEVMFHESYAFHSSTSKHMQTHFKMFAESITEKYLAGKNDPFVVELGSNDGIMLRNFQASGMRHLGVEPSVNVADIARSHGINTISQFFDDKLAEQISQDHGKADAILAANVMCHIPDISGIAKGVASLLSEDGVLVFEDPYLGDMISKTSYDQIYDEHVFIFSARSVSNAFDPYGLELIDVEHQQTHGGSMRYSLGRKGQHAISSNVAIQLEKENALGLDKPETYDSFRKNCELSRDNLVGVLETLKKEGKRVVGYGATSKSTTVTNYCGIGPQHVEFISDTTPVKQGKLSPGTHIPVKPYDAFVSDYPEYALLFAWNHEKEIREKEDAFAASGGNWITYVPEVKIKK